MRSKFFIWSSFVVLVLSVALSCQTTKKGDKDAAVDCTAFKYYSDCQTAGCAWDNTYGRCYLVQDYTAICRQLVGESQCRTNFNCRYDYTTRLCLSNTVNCPNLRTQTECQQYTQYCNWTYMNFLCSNRAQASLVNCAAYTTIADCNRFPNDCITSSNTNVCVNRPGTTQNCTGLLKAQCDANQAYCTWNYSTQQCVTNGTNTAVVCGNYLYESQCSGYPTACRWDSYSQRCLNISGTCAQYLQESPCRNAGCTWDSWNNKCQ